jgi:hypothetical protein
MALGQLDLVDYYMQLERRVGRLERTSSVSNNQSDTTFVGTLTISGLNVASQTVVAYGSDYQVYINMGWSAPSFDSNVITDDELKGYYISWTKDGTNYTAEQFTDSTSATFGPMAQGQSITFRVRVVTQKGTLGPYASTTFSTTLDNTAPAQPSTPVASPYIGQVRVYWDGLTVSATAMPADMVACEIHISTSSITFTPTVATLVDVFYPGGGYYTITDLSYGTTYYVRLVAVDQVGNRSPSSTGTSVIPVQAADGDIASLNIGKLVAGTLSADMTVSARIKTANTGARVELNSSGLQAYNSSNVQTVDIDASTGNGTLTGKIQTGLTGTRIIIDPSGFGLPTIAFMPASGSNYAFINAAGDLLGMNSQQGTVSGTTTYSRIILGSNSGAFMQVDATQTIWGGNITVGAAGIDMYTSGGTSRDISITCGSGGNLTLAGNLPTTGNTPNVYQPSGGSIQQSTSSRTVKTNIEDLEYKDLFEGMKALRPIIFHDKRDWETYEGNSDKVLPQIGLIAEEVEEIPQPLRDLLYVKNIHVDGTVLPPGVAYDRIGVLLLPFVRTLWEDYQNRNAA